MTEQEIINETQKDIIKSARESGEEHYYASEFTHESEIDDCIDGCARSFIDGMKYVLKMIENVENSTDVDDALGDFRDLINELNESLNSKELTTFYL